MAAAEAGAAIKGPRARYPLSVPLGAPWCGAPRQRPARGSHRTPGRPCEYPRPGTGRGSLRVLGGERAAEHGPGGGDPSRPGGALQQPGAARWLGGVCPSHSGALSAFCLCFPPPRSDPAQQPAPEGVPPAGGPPGSPPNLSSNRRLQQTQAQVEEVGSRARSSLWGCGCWKRANTQGSAG